MNKYKPMLAEAAADPFSGEGWLFEVKWDGIRALAYVGETLSILSRNGHDLTARFPELHDLKERAPGTVLDGEIIVMQGGHPDFSASAKRSQASKKDEVKRLSEETPATYIVFDILEKQGEPLVDRPLMERRRILKESLKEGAHVVVSDAVEREGEAYFKAVTSRGLEGIVAKKMQGAYRSGERSRDWLKVKAVKTVDCVVFGYTPGEGARAKSFGALIIGLYDKGKPVYVGRVGTGFTDKALAEFRSILDKITVKDPPFTADDIPEGTVYVNPTLVVEVGYQEVTGDGRLRAPRLVALRSDKAPADCTLDQVNMAPLKEYREKRDFEKTSEPPPVVKPAGGNKYVVQEHHARRLHWDLRLEREGVLKSWAVPKQPPEEPGERRLAVQVEDHPLDYGGFEGTIPEGEYGAGTVKIWDAGTYETREWSENKIHVTIHGERLKGGYELVRFAKAGKNDWLFFKKREG